MKSFVILADSTADLSLRLREEYGIDYLKMGFASPDRSYEASLDWEDISPEEFYGAMRRGVSFKTSQVPVQTFIYKFGEYLSKGEDILYIGCSSALSGSVEASALAKERLKGEYPDGKILCIDSLISGMGQGLMAIKASEMRDSGFGIDEVYEKIMSSRLNYNQMGSTGSLEYLKKAGRVTTSSAFFGDLFAVKPLIISDTKGQNLAIAKAKGRKASMTASVEHIAKYIKNPSEQTVWIGHADCLSDAETLAALIKEKLGVTDVKINVIGPIVGASVGPGTFIIYYYGEDKAQQMPNV